MTPCHNTIWGPQVLDAAESATCVNDIRNGRPPSTSIRPEGKPKRPFGGPSGFLNRIVHDAIAKAL